MATFVTTKFIDGEKHEGDNIVADSWDEAELIAKEKGVTVDGILIATCNEDFTEWREYQNSDDPTQSNPVHLQ